MCLGVEPHLLNHEHSSSFGYWGMIDVELKEPSVEVNDTAFGDLYISARHAFGHVNTGNSLQSDQLFVRELSVNCAARSPGA